MSKTKKPAVKNESAKQLVSRLLEDFDMTPPMPGAFGAGGGVQPIDPDQTRNKISHLMRLLGVDYETAKEVVLSDDDSRPALPPTAEGLETAAPDKHCGRCGSKRHTTTDCRLLGIPI